MDSWAKRKEMMKSMKTVIQFTDVRKKHPNFQFENSFILEEGQIVGLVGRNGAGKTTLINLLLNVISKDSGTVIILGNTTDGNFEEIKQQIGVVYDNNYFLKHWKVSEVEKNMGMFFDKWDSEKFRVYLNKFNISYQKKIMELSKGMQMKLMVAFALAHNAEILVLDEPTSGLDPFSRQELMQILKEYVSDMKHTVLLSTHIISDLENVADRILYIENGKIILDEFVNALMKEYSIVFSKDKEIEKYLMAKGVCISENIKGKKILIKTEELNPEIKVEKEQVRLEDIILFYD